LKLPTWRCVISLATAFFLFSPRAINADNLHQDARNPIANVGKFMVANDLDFGFGPLDKTSNLTNIEAVVPIALGEELRLMLRPIVPLIYQPELSREPVPGLDIDDPVFGLGDISLFQFFTHPSAINIPHGHMIFGLGSQWSFPSAADDRLGSGKYAAGPAAIVTVYQWSFVYGAAVSNKWSFAGDRERAGVNAMTLEPFASYIMKDGWYLTSTPIITANWEADQDDRWTVPAGGGFGRVFDVFKQRVDAQVQGFYFPVSPDDAGADWRVRFQIALLFPK